MEATSEGEDWFPNSCVCPPLSPPLIGGLLRAIAWGCCLTVRGDFLEMAFDCIFILYSFTVFNAFKNIPITLCVCLSVYLSVYLLLLLLLDKCLTL